LSRLHSALGHVCKSLSDANVDWALIGGLAVAARSEPRFTRDIDIVVAVDSDADAERKIFALTQTGYEIDTTIEQTKAGRMSTVRMRLTHPDFVGVLLDILFASSGIEAEIVRSAETVEMVPGVSVPLARTGHLLALKILSHSETRPQDAIDIKMLLDVADEADVDLARSAVALIENRGFNRGSDLSSALLGWISRFAGSDT
jgi:predicted nucleotidyltransferase